jgi:very-short-patch-repair endonuclease
MVRGERVLSHWLRQHHGVVARSQLVSLGFSHGQIHRLVTSGRLYRLYSAVYVAADTQTGLQQRALAACLATGGVISHSTAARLWEFRSIPKELSVHVTVSHDRRVAPRAGVVVHRSTDMSEHDWVVRDDGIVLTSPPRTVFDLAAALPRMRLESVIEQGIDRGNFTVPTLWGVARRLARQGRAGSGRFVTVLASREAWAKPVDSALELTFETALIHAGIARPIRQHTIRLYAGRDIHPDFAWPDLQVIVEIDHVTWHGGRIESSRDKWRDRKTLRLGWSTLRLTDDDIKHRLADAVADVASVLQRSVQVG